MSSAPLIPQSFWFRFGLLCPRRDDVPRTAAPPERLLDLPAECVLPSPGRLENRAPWAETRTAWNPRGLAFQVTVAGRSRSLSSRGVDTVPAESVHLWIDTRDTRDIHRASRFCHHFVATLAPGRGETPVVTVSQPPIHRAQTDAPGPGRSPSWPVLSGRARGG